MLEHGQSNAGRPLRQRVVGVEVEQVSILAGGGDAEHILEGLDGLVPRGQRINLDVSVWTAALDGLTILIDASVRLTKVGTTSPSCPAASKADASHRLRTVPTSWAKHSVQFRS